MIKAQDLINGFRKSLDDKWGYIYGMTHEAWTTVKQEAYQREYAGDPDRENSCKYGEKWAGHWVTDCSGLFHYWFSRLGGKIAHGSNTIWDDYCTKKGELMYGLRTDTESLLPGTAVFTSSGDRHNHIGLFIGNDTVIEAAGALHGVITSKCSNKKWTHWGELKGVDYGDGKEEKMITATVVLPTGASGSTVNMREKPSKGSGIVKRVPVGSSVEVLEDQGQWCHIEFSGYSGWMMSDYLEYGGGEGESEGETVTVPKDQLKAMCDTITGWLEGKA